MKIMHEDPGHGWLEVPREELKAAGVEAQISRFSYQTVDGLMVFLEEDEDLRKYATATGWVAGMSFGEWARKVGGITGVNYNTECWIRDLPSYRAG